MKRFQSILCASLLTMAISSAALAGDLTSRAGDLTSKPGDLTSKPGDLTSLTDEAYAALISLLGAMLP